MTEGTAATAWAKLVGTGFLRAGAGRVLSVEEFSWLRPPFRGFWRPGTVRPGEGLLVPGR